MKITKLLLAIAIVTFALASCKKTPQGLTNAIPTDAGYVVHLNTQSLIEKSKYDIFKNVTVERGINMAKAFLGGNKETVDLLDGLLKDMNSTGLNLKNDCYFYTDYVKYGLVLGVNDAEKIKKSIMAIPQIPQNLIKEEEGVYYIQENEFFTIAWNKEKFLIIGKMNPYAFPGQEGGAQEENLLAQAKKQLSQGEKESINSNPAFANFVKDQKDISVFYSYSFGNMKGILEMAGIQFPEEVVNEFEQLKGVTATSYISFEKGEITADSKLHYNTPEAEKKYKELTANLCGTLKGEQLKYVSENPILLVSLNVKGKGIYDYLKKLNVLSKIETEVQNEDINLESLLSNLEGDVTFALTNILSVKKSYDYGDGEKHEYDSSLPELSLFVDLKNGEDLLKLFKDKISSKGIEDNKLKEIDGSTYSFDMDGTVGYMGISNNIFYLTNNEKTYNGVKTSTPVSKGYDNLVKGNLAMITGSFQALKAPIIKEINDEKGQQYVTEIIDMFGNVEFTTSNQLEGKGKIELTDKSQNSFAVICLYLDKVLNSVNEYIKF